MVAATALCCSCYTDLKDRKIPNYITFPTIILGIFLCILSPEKDLLYAVIGLGIWFFLGALNLMGLGDVKLMMALSVLFGFHNSIYIILGACAAMFIYCAATDRRNLKYALINLKNFLLYRTRIPTEDRPKYPFSVFITIGYLIWIIISTLLQ